MQGYVNGTLPTITDNVGQTDGNFLTTYKEHLRSSRTNNSKSGLVQHLIDNNHVMGINREYDEDVTHL